jgi:RNA polymerase sigma-70 factor (ECF subfamily)
MPDPRFAEIEGHRPYLMRYALAQLRDAQLAEEAVQEALPAALESLASFGGKSMLRWRSASICRNYGIQVRFIHKAAGRFRSGGAH